MLSSTLMFLTRYDIRVHENTRKHTCRLPSYLQPVACATGPTAVAHAKSSTRDSDISALVAVLREGERVGESGKGYERGEEAVKAKAGDVRELFHTPILRRATLCL